MKRIVTVAALVSVATNMSAQGWSLDSCINYAVSHNITVKSRQLDRYSAELDVTEAKDAFLPKAQADVSQSFNFGRGLTSENTYADRNTSQTGWSVGVNVPLFQGLSAVRRLDYSRANLKAIAEQCEVAKDNITLQVISQYLQVLYSGEVFDVATEQERMSHVQLERTSVLVEEGKLPELDLTQAKSQLAQDHFTTVNADNDRRLALLELSQLLQLPSVDGFDILPLDSPEQKLLSVNDVYDNALEHNHSIRAARLSIDAASQSIRLAKTGYLPTLSFNAGIGSNYYKVSGVPNSSFTRQMRDNFNTYLGFTLSVPLFDAFATRNAVRKANVSLRTANLQLEDTRSNLYKAIQQAYRQASAAAERLQASLTAESATREALDAMEVKYEFGRANATELEQTRSDYIRARLQTVQARYESLLRQRILEFYNRQN